MADPGIGWDDVGGLGQIKNRLRALIEQPLRYPELFERVGLSTNLGVAVWSAGHRQDAAGQGHCVAHGREFHSVVAHLRNSY